MLLALETSDRLCAACLYDSDVGRVVASRTLDLERGHAAHLIGMIGDVLSDAGAAYESLTQLAVCTGPGSFTGIRVALATAVGLSVSLAIPVRGVTALQALAFAAAPKAAGAPVAAVIDAHRGDVYLQRFAGDGAPLDAPRQLTLAQAALAVSSGRHCLCGSAAALLLSAAPAAGLTLADGVVLPDVDALAACAAQPALTVEAKPLYLRKPDAKPQQAYADARALRT